MKIPEYRFSVGRRGRRYQRCITYCEHCERIEFMDEAGPFMWRCNECQRLTAKNLDLRRLCG